jgi:hypothetical protein
MSEMILRIPDISGVLINIVGWGTSSETDCYSPPTVSLSIKISKHRLTYGKENPSHEYFPYQFMLVFTVKLVEYEWFKSCSDYLNKQAHVSMGSCDNYCGTNPTFS